MGKPAARITDMYVCPKRTGKILHVGGPTAAGSPNFHHFPGFQETVWAIRQPGPERINDFYHVSEAHWDHAAQHTDDRHWYSEAAP